MAVGDVYVLTRIGFLNVANSCPVQISMFFFPLPLASLQRCFCELNIGCELPVTGARRCLLVRNRCWNKFRGKFRSKPRTSVRGGACLLASCGASLEAGRATTSRLETSCSAVCPKQGPPTQAHTSSYKVTALCSMVGALLRRCAEMQFCWPGLWC